MTRENIRAVLVFVVFVVIMLVSLPGCAGRGAVAYFAQSTKEVVTAVYNPWDSWVRERVAGCETKYPPWMFSIADFDMCLGPAKNQPAVEKALEAYHLAALALYVAITMDAPDRDVEAARRELARSALALVAAIPGVTKEVDRAKKLVEGKMPWAR